jgi:hypothetical protein
MSTSSQYAFTPLGLTVAVSSSSTPPAGSQAPVIAKFDPQATGQYRFVNQGAVVVFLGHGVSATDAQASAVIPITGTPSRAIPLLPGRSEILRFGIDTFFSAISTTAITLFVTPGKGI